MTALIVDDERLARRELRRLLAVHAEVEVVGEAGDAEAALAGIEQLRPSVVFLDIRMPGESGLELAARLLAPAPRIIFTTAYDAHALRAFELNALDYLLKPILPERLAVALKRLSPAPVEAEAGSAPGETFGWEERVLLRSDERAWFVPVSSIRLLESEGNYTRVHFGKECPMIHRSLAALEVRLPRGFFLRANRSQVVNLQCIEAIEPWFSGSFRATLIGGMSVEFSRRQAQLLREQRGL